MTKVDREVREYNSLFKDERYAKSAWRKFMGEALESPVANIPQLFGANGEQTIPSVIYDAAKASVMQRLVAQGIERPPMKAEIIVEAAVIRAAMDTSTMNTLLDRTAGKVKEEISVSQSAYSELTDEQLELLAAAEEKKRLGNNNGNT